MSEIIFVIKESPEGGFEARALDYAIFTDGDTMDEIRENVREAVHCHFEADHPKIIRLHYVKEEIISALSSRAICQAVNWLKS